MEYVLGVHLTVPFRIARRITSARKRAYFLGHTLPEFPPHVTLYLCRFSREAYLQLLTDLRGLRLPTAAIQIDRVQAKPENRDSRFVVLQIQRTKSLVRLHTIVTTLGNRLRKNLIRKKDIQRIRTGEYSTFERNNTVRFGYRGAGRGFLPHLTVSRVPGRPAVARQLARSLAGMVGVSWRAKTMVVGLYRYNTGVGHYVGQARERIVRLR